MKQPDEDQALIDGYRKASEENAGRPSAATRQAILAEAAAAARRQKPAANDARYVWRGVAGVAVLGLAVLMWQQVDHRMPGERPVVAVAPAMESTDGGNTQEAPPMTPPSVAPVVTAPAESREPFPASSPSTSASPSASPSPSPAPAPAPPASQRMAAADTADAAANSSGLSRMEETAELQAAAPARAPAPAAAARAESKMSAAADAETDADALLRLHFPRQYQSSSSHRLWLVQDGTGNVLRSGELTAEQDFGGMRSRIERDLGGRLLRPWRIRTLRNAQGQTIELGVAQTP